MRKLRYFHWFSLNPENYFLEIFERVACYVLKSTVLLVARGNMSLYKYFAVKDKLSSRTGPLFFHCHHLPPLTLQPMENG